MNPLNPTSTSRLWLVELKTKRTRQNSGCIKTRREAVEEQRLYISLLSQDMIMEILSRLPIHSLFQCTLVSKAWHDIIIHNPIFLSMQHNRALENQNDTLSLMLCLRNPKGTHLYLLERGGVGHCKFTMIDAQLTGLKVNFCTGLNGRFEIVGSCNGLLCITFFENHRQLVYISNPITGECLMLPSKERTWLLGFGFHSARNEYKVLRAVCDKPANISSWKVEIYTLGTNAWRQIEDVPLSYMTCLFCPASKFFSDILVNGSLHWCGNSHIVSLDMGDEKFGVVTTPDSFTEHSPDHVMNLMVWKGCLTVVERPAAGDRSIQAWVMKEYNVKESWTKQVNVKWPTWFARRCNYWPFDDESFIDDLKSIKHPRFRANSLLKVKSKFKVMPHVGSLLSLKTVAGKERVQNIKFLPGVSVEGDARNI